MSQADELRAQVYHQLRLRETLDLVAMWQAHDRSQWSDVAFDVMEQLIKERLGQLPAREAPSDEQPVVSPDEIDQNADPEIRQLWLAGDVDSLSQTMRHDPDWMRRLDAAQALAHLGDELGDDYIDEALSDPAPDVRALAQELRDWLDADEEDSEAGTETRTSLPDYEQADEEATDQAAASEFQVDEGNFPITHAFDPGPSLEQISGHVPGESRTPPRRGLPGAAGGALGLLAFYLALYFLNAVPATAGGEGSWIWESAFVYLPLALGMGAALASFGSRLGSNTTDLVGADSSDEDMAPMIGALTLGGIGGFGVSALLFLLTQH
jgi:hypothetical protein